ncbi:TetR/AcrR family transcriptional regulator [Conexibacter stalactiti]|uniref:TetR/AcrR family transcriptional regulator n=1 Tax=Conexibacter stalactiti TaxID=1940611 RepID=A0ABU4HYS2_9ACTN|nr:TetR/AcrR family transcriptional regulator [Conexibacter stalactiti]MDW5598421.1 TetR/AcrR family transcriptional regulator [Conexibacter stalactiti]MEC5039063.1 TetR/AcrR family transcriptional regulator [Conexibacter stalactiti]
MARRLDPSIDDAIAAATLALLRQRGFAAMTVEEVARAAGVGKPAIYRRHRDKATLVAAVIARQLEPLEVPDLSDTRAELWRALSRGLPADGPAYVRLIGGLIGEQERHPELIDAFRASVLGPRRAAVRALIERGQARGDLRAEVDPTVALDALAGPFLARVFAGESTGPRWRRRAFDHWWTTVEERTGR